MKDNCFTINPTEGVALEGKGKCLSGKKKKRTTNLHQFTDSDY